MAVIRLRRDEVDLVASAADRKAKRSHSRFVINEDRIEVTGEENLSDSHDDEPAPTLRRA